MSKFKVTYNKTPTIKNPEKCLIIQAEDHIEAIITAFDHLTNKGHVVAKASALRFSLEESKRFETRGVRFEHQFAGDGMIVITGVSQYTVKPTGKVIE